MDPLSGGLKVAVYIITLIFAYFTLVTLFPDSIDKDIAKTIITYLQTILTLLVGYYWGNSSERKRLKDSQADDYAKASAMALEAERIDAAKEEAGKKEAERLRLAEEAAHELIEEEKRKGEENVSIDKAA